MKQTITIIALALVGCSPTPGAPPRDGSMRDGDAGTSIDAPNDRAMPDAAVDAMSDRDVPPDADVDAALGDADASDSDDGSAPVGVLVAVGVARTEICGNEFDDDDNGMIDDGCYCSVGTERPCWLGPPDARGVGECHDGTQLCESDGTFASWGECADQGSVTLEVLENGRDDDCDGLLDELDGVCVPVVEEESGTRCTNGRDDDCDTVRDCADPSCAGASGCTSSCAGSETLCYGGRDDDCDSRLDCADSDCVGDPSCALGTGSAACPTGTTPTYRDRTMPSAWGSSSISVGDGQPIMTRSCETQRCGPGQVAVVTSSTICVPPIAVGSCPSGTYETYGAGGWRCEPPCELVVHYGSIYGGQNVCASYPRISCSIGTVPTFVLETETWECRATCNNTLYDQLTLEGRTVCVPC